MKNTGFNTLRCFSAKMIAITATLLLITALPQWTAHGSEPDTAQKLLFDNPYLASLAAPAEIAYRFEHSTADETSYGRIFSDDVRIEVAPPGGKQRLNSVTLHIFTGERARSIGPLSDVSGNPVIMVFLERDAFQMKRRVPGPMAMFRNMIRKAMREAATVEDVEIELSGKTVAAKRVTIRPFDDDRNPPQLRQFRNKTYHFTVSEVVPGGIFEIVSVLPDPANREKALVRDRIAFTGTEER